MTTKPCATYEDVNLVLRLYELRRESKLREARGWFSASFRVKKLEEFDQLCPLGSEPNALFRMVVSYWDMVASFVTGGVLHPDLFFESNRELLFVWERIRDLLPAVRERNKDPFFLHNLEEVANSYVQWLNQRAPGSYEAFSKRVRGG